MKYLLGDLLRRRTLGRDVTLAVPTRPLVAVLKTWQLDIELERRELVVEFDPPYGLTRIASCGSSSASRRRVNESGCNGDLGPMIDMRRR